MDQGSNDQSRNTNPTNPTNPTNLDLFNIIKELVAKVNSLENQVTDLKNQITSSSTISSSSNSSEPKKSKKEENKAKQKEEKKERAKRKTKKDDEKKKNVSQLSPDSSLPIQVVPIEIPIPSAVLDDLTPPIVEETCELQLHTHPNFEQMFRIDEMVEENTDKMDEYVTEDENMMEMDGGDLSEDEERIEKAKQDNLLRRKEEEECTNEELMSVTKEIPQFIFDKLFPHQKRGVKFLWDNISKGNGCVLADFMGMGKTLQTASFLHLFFSQKQAKTALIVSPASVNTHWIREFDRIEKWMSDPNAPCIKPLLLSSRNSIQDRKKTTTNWFENGGVMITSYDMFRTLCVDDDFKECLLNPGPDIIILDEGHKIRHLSSKITRALNSVNTPKRIILTGYPFQNNLLEYWTMINFVCPRYLGEKSEFKRKYSQPIQKGQISKIPYERRIARRRSWVLYEKVKSIILRRDASLLKKLLPQKQEILLTLSNSDVQKKMYKTLIESLKSIGKPSIFWTYDVVIMLCNHPDVLYNYFIWKEKQAETQKIEKESKNPTTKKVKESYSAEEETNNGEVFDPSINDEEIESYIDREVEVGDEEQKKDMEAIAISILTEIFKNPENIGYKKGALGNGGKMILLFSVMFQCKSVGDRLIVFSRSINTLNFVETTLKRYNKDKEAKGQLNFMRFDGSTPFDQRQTCIDKINDNSNNMTVLLISTLAGCEGINLMGANRVALIDVNWNPSHDSEAVCRVFRIGQTKPVFIYRFICENTMEDLVLKRQLQKENLSNWIVDNGNSSIDTYDTKNLLALPDNDEILNEEPEIDPQISDSMILDIIKENNKWIKRVDFRDQLLRDDPLNILTEEEKTLAHSENEFESVYGGKRNYERKTTTNQKKAKPTSSNTTTSKTSAKKPEEPINTNYLKNQESLWLRRQQILVEKETVEASKLLQILQTTDIPITVNDNQSPSVQIPTSASSESKPSHSQFEKEKNNIMKQLITKNKTNNPKTQNSACNTSFEDPYEIEMEHSRVHSEHQKKRSYKDYHNNDSKGGYRNNRNHSSQEGRDYGRDSKDNRESNRDYRDSRDNRDRNHNYRDQPRDNYSRDKRPNNYDGSKRYKKY